LETILAKTYKQVDAHGIIGGDLVRPLQLMLTVTSISLICILCCSLVFALNPDEASVSMFWSSQTVYPGDTVSVRITLKSNYAEQLKIYYIGIHFDWMDPDSFYGSDLSDNPVIVPSYGTYIFDAIAVQIPLNVTAGSHSYFVGIDGTEGASFSSFSWDSPESTVQIHGLIEKIYSDLVPQVESKLNEAISANYGSAEARSLLQQAQYEYNLAHFLANEERWNEAISSLYNATDLLEQADVAEQKSAEQQSLLFYLAIIAIVVIIVVSIILVVLRKKRKQTEAVADQPLETIEEQS
jgi:hypothetical protein